MLVIKRERFVRAGKRYSTDWERTIWFVFGIPVYCKWEQQS